MGSAPRNIVHEGKPSRSALGVATLRAAHQLLDEPIVLADPVALPILGAKAAAELRDDPFVFNDHLVRGLRAQLVVRSRFAEDELARVVAAGVRQYVLLGAGLDTFAYRNPHEGLRVFEIDHPSTQQWKRQLLEEAGISLPDGLTFAPIDFEHRSLAQGLAEAGFRLDQPACFAWLGVTMYLTPAAILEVLGFVAGLPKGSSITFDYRIPLSRLNPIERAAAEMLGQRVATLGEPWLSAFEPAWLRAQVLGLGFGEAEDCGGDELNGRYLARRKDGLRMGGASRLMCARV
jgi:methyltransferase (TIGR00027 family)